MVRLVQALLVAGAWLQEITLGCFPPAVDKCYDQKQLERRRFIWFTLHHLLWGIRAGTKAGAMKTAAYCPSPRGPCSACSMPLDHLLRDGTTTVS